MTEREFKDWFQIARAIAIGGSIIILCCSFVYDMHLPSKDEERLKNEAEDKQRKESHDKVQEAKKQGKENVISPKANLEAYLYYLDHTAANHSDNHRDNHSDRLMEGKDNNDRGGNGTYDRS